MRPCPWATAVSSAGLVSASASWPPPLAANPGQDLDTKRLPSRDFCAAQGWTDVAEYTDEASAADLRGDAHATKRRFDLLVVWKTDRMARSVLDGAVILEQFRGWGVGLRSYTEPWLDTTNPFGEAMYHITITWARRHAARAGQGRGPRAAPRVAPGSASRERPARGSARVASAGVRGAGRTGDRYRGGAAAQPRPGDGCADASRGGLKNRRRSPPSSVVHCRGGAQCDLGGAKPGVGSQLVGSGLPSRGVYCFFVLRRRRSQRASAPSGTMNTRAYPCNRIPPPPDQLRLPPRTRGGEGETRAKPPGPRFDGRRGALTGRPKGGRSWRSDAGG